MPLNMSNMVLLAMKQTALGTPATPLPGTHAILCRGLAPKPIKAKFVERKLLRGSKGNSGSLAGGIHNGFEFEVELAGSGTAGTAPKFAPLLLGCNMNETLSAGVSAVYQPHNVEGDYLTLWAYLDGVLFKMPDAKGTVSLVLNSEDIPVMKYSFLGRYEAPSDAPVPPGIVFTGFQQPLIVNDLNTQTLSLSGIELVTQSFTLDLGNKLVFKDLPNSSGVRSPDRKATASAVFEMTKVATRNWAEDVRLGSEMPLSILHGTTAGNRVGITAPKLSFNQEPSLSDSDGTAMLSGSFDVKPNLSNDELVLSFT